MFRRRLKKTGNLNKNRYKLTEERKWKEKKVGLGGGESATNPIAGKKSKNSGREGPRESRDGCPLLYHRSNHRNGSGTF